MDRREFAQLIAAACAAFPETVLAKETVEIYWRSLESTPYVDASRRLEKHINTEKFFPRIADLRRQDPYYGPPAPKMLPAPKPNLAKVDGFLAKMRAKVGAAMSPQPLPKPAPHQNRIPVEGGCTCEVGSKERCDYCRWWSATYG